MSAPDSSNRSLSQVALYSAILGTVFGGCLILALSFYSYSRLALYISFLCLFHFLEFLLTAIHHPSTVTIDCNRHLCANALLAFLLDHSASYCLTILAAVLEYTLLRFFFAPRSFGWVSYFGIFVLCN